MGFISINKRFTVSGEELAAVVVEVSCTAPAGAFARGSVKGVELAVVIAPADAHAMPVPWDLGYRELVRSFAARGSSFVGRASGKQEAILDLLPRTKPKKGSRVRCHRRHVDGAHRVYGMSSPDKANDTVGVSTVENVAVFHILHGDVDIFQHLAI